MPNFAAIVTFILNKTLNEGQTKTLAGLGNDNSTVLEKLKVKYLEPVVMALPCLQVGNSVDTNAGTNQIDYITLQMRHDVTERTT